MSGMGAGNADSGKKGKKGKKGFGEGEYGEGRPGGGDTAGRSFMGPAARTEGINTRGGGGNTPKKVMIPVSDAAMPPVPAKVVKTSPPVSEAAKKTAQAKKDRLSRYKKLRAKGRKTIMTTELEDFK